MYKIKIGDQVIYAGQDGMDALNKAFKEEVQRQLAEYEDKEATLKESRKRTEIAEGLRSINPDKIKGGKPSSFILDEAANYPFRDVKPWYENPESETYKQWTKERNKMNKKTKKYKQ